MTNFQQVSTTQPVPGQEQRFFNFQTTQLIWLFLGLLEAAFALRFLFKLIGAEPANPFATLLYAFTGIFLLPFAGTIGTPAAGSLVLELSTVIAMVAYALLGWALERVVWIIFYRPYAAVAISQTTITDQRAR